MTQLKSHWDFANTLDLGTYPRNQEMWFSLTDLDSEHRYDSDPPDNWEKYSFSYRYNSHGFRSREFDLSKKKPVILTFGCSHTVGVGVPFDTTWGEIFGRRFPDHVVYNAGVGGAGPDTIARLASQMIPIICPDIVAILWPSMYRFETYTNGDDKNGTQFMGPWSDPDDIRLQFEDNNSYNNLTKNKMIVIFLEKMHKFTYLSLTLDNIEQKFPTTKWTKARDKGHFGPDWHTQVNEEFYLEYLKKRVV